MKKKLLALSLILFSCFGAFAQGSTFVSGFVTDADGFSTYNAFLMVNGDSYALTSDANGIFNEFIEPAIDFKRSI